MLISIENKYSKLLIGALLVRLFVYADIEDFKTSGLSKESFEFSKVCKFFGVKEAVLISKEGKRRIDCMGKSFFIADFCYDKYKSKKGYAYPEFDPVEKKVNCYFAETIQLSLTCKKKYSKVCEEPSKGCKGLGKLYARNLDLINSSLLESYPPILKCYYSKKQQIDIPKPVF